MTTTVLSLLAGDRDAPAPAQRMAGLIADAALHVGELSTRQLHELLTRLRTAADEVIQAQPWRRRGMESVLDRLERYFTEGTAEFAEIDGAPFPLQVALLHLPDHRAGRHSEGHMMIDTDLPLVLEQNFASLDRPRLVPGIVEATVTDGLAIAPRLERVGETGRWAFTSEWVLVHMASHMNLMHIPGMSLGHARELAQLLGECGIDWTQPADTLFGPELGPKTREVLSRAFHLTMAAVKQHRPVLLSESSWRLLPPPWVVDVLDRDGRVRFTDTSETYTGAERLAVEFGENLDSDGEEVRIRRSADPVWELRCARRDCGHPLSDCTQLPRHCVDRQELIVEATREYWQALDDRRWLCPTCDRLCQPAPSRFVP